ncbi:MAG TPA: C4-dicarboxylate transporter DcuC [Gemmataceae bacterium]|nr:C4-dicarboxylate transporter DcuC [Gemmataceae bacterium]
MWDVAVPLLALLIVGLAVYAVARGIDVRLVLLVAAFALAGLRGKVEPIVAKFLATFTDEQYVVPICTAMGFAYVLRLTECDLHLVRFLVKPLRSARLFLVPGVVLVGFLVNVPIISQTSTAVCLGAVVVPLMRAARMSDLTIGACVLLGASIGGELLNPGAPELNTIAKQLKIDPDKVVPAVEKIVFVHLVLTTLLFWLVSWRADRKATPTAAVDEVPAGRINLLRAIVPFVPLAILYLQGDPFRLFDVPDRWLFVDVVEGKRDPRYATRLIGLAMLIGVVAAVTSAPARVRQAPKAFFDGAGYAFAEVISIIVVASCFGKAIELTGLASFIGRAVGEAPAFLTPISGLVPLAFAALSGSGMAATQSLYASFVASAEALGVDPKDVGAMVALGAAAGRTMSPVAAVALMSAKLTGTNSFRLARRVAGPLLISLLVVIGLRMARVI